MKISTQTFALASARHPWRVIAAWVVTATLALVAVGVLLGDALTTEGRPTNNPESERALELRAQAFPGRSLATDVVIVSSERYTVDSPPFRALVGELAGELRGVDGVRRGASLVSSDRHAALVQLSVADADYAEGVIAAVRRADAHPTFEANVTGETTREHDFNQLSQDDLKSGELQFGLPAALIILLLVFGGAVAGLVPLLMAMTSIVVALGLTALVAQGFELSVFVVNMLTGMGLALGIDYALFVVSRYREERDRGREPLDAISASGATASRAVLFSGTAFVIAMFGMLLVPSSIMRSLAVGAILVGAVLVATALTLLPALLGLLGDRVDALRIPLIGRRPSQTGSSEGRFWGAVVRRFDSVIDPAPYVIAFVLGLTFVLLTIVFRSIVIAGLSVLLNLLSVGAAFGLLVLVFQHGVGADLLGFQKVESIEAWVPLFLFSVLFGLSMDYQVFMLSRIKERYEESRDTADAVQFGVSSTARIITGAALIIVAVFAGFARGDLIMFQQMGFGVAVALLIDATVIRSVLLPSAMKLLGRWNWYVPSWLEWLPRVRLEARSQT